MTDSTAANTNSNPTDDTASGAPGPDDPRYAFAQVTNSVGTLIESVPDSAIGLPTPCTEFTVKDMLEHLVMVMRRVAVVGRGEHWSTVDTEEQDSGWAESYRSAAHDVMEAWMDAAKLGQTFEVPWGEFPGAPIIMTYTAELAVHGWDLATATGADFSIDDHLLGGALMAAKFIPADGRGDEDMPFDDVVDPGPGASVLDQLAGWMGRQVVPA